MNDTEYNRALVALDAQVEQERKDRIEQVKELQAEFVVVDISGRSMK